MAEAKNALEDELAVLDQKLKEASLNKKVVLTEEQAKALLSSWDGDPDFDTTPMHEALANIRKQLKPKRKEPSSGPWARKDNGDIIAEVVEGPGEYNTWTVACKVHNRADARLIVAAPKYHQWAKRMLESELPMEPGDEDTTQFQSIFDNVYEEQ